MKVSRINHVLMALGVAVVTAATTIFSVNQVAAQDFRGTPQYNLVERYEPTIWVDPDGCEHWVMDDGAEGYMTPHVSRQGIPVCRRQNVCGVMSSDQFFATDSFRISASGQQRLRDFFSQSTATAFVIAGHTDSRASDAYNMRLSYNRANSVAAVARSVGARVVDVRGYGERVPAAPNNTVAGMAKNRRVEILCIQ